MKQPLQTAEIQLRTSYFCNQNSLPMVCCAHFWVPLVMVVLFCGGFAPSNSEVYAEDFRENFNSEKTSCKVFFNPHEVALKTHERNQSLAFSGQSAERFQFITQKYDVSVVIECDIEPTRIFEELAISISAYSNRPGIQIAARVVFPGQKDPQTGLPLTRLIQGDFLKKTNAWQKLNCATTNKIVGKHLTLWRASLKPQKLDPRRMYIDKIYLRQTLGRGMTEILIDELLVSPVISPNRTEKVTTVAHQVDSSVPKIEFQLDQLLVGGRPFFPIVIPYQHEPLALFDQLGVNVVWVDNYQNNELIGQLNRQGIWATAWPPSAKSEQGEILNAGSANMISFDKKTQGILFWNLGVRVEPDTHQQLRQWVDQVKSSDRKYNRPISADVTGKENLFSRDLEMLGISKHIVQTPYSFQDYTNHLQRRMRLAQPGTFVMSWLQTEPSRSMTQYREATKLTPAVVEPEQIRLQTYAAICAGCKGLGYWNWTPLNAEGPGKEERRLVLEQLTQELELLEPFLAGGEVIHRFDVSLIESAKSSRKTTGTHSLEKPGNKAAQRARAAVVRSEHGQVILLSAIEENAQFVPGQMAANDVRIQVRGLPESAFLWEITPTGLWPLETERVTGYTEVRLPRFNMTAALMVATDQGVARKIEAKIRTIKSRNAELTLLLAEEKFARVMKIDSELTGLGVGLPEAVHILSQSRRAIDESRKSWKKQQYNQARRSAELASQLLRILQRSHWERAISAISHPNSIPHTSCFQTLPDYWRLVQHLGKGEIEEITLLRSGQFEDRDAMFVEGWKRDISQSKQIVVYDALDPNHVHQGDYCLRAASLLADHTKPASLNKPAITYRSPKFALQPGDILHVSGWVRIPRPITGSLEGFRIYDTHFGSSACLHWNKPGEWQSFELIRPIWKQEKIQLVMELNGLGDVAIDDLKIKVIKFKNPEILHQASEEKSLNPEGATKNRPHAIEFLNRLLK